MKKVEHGLTSVEVKANRDSHFSTLAVLNALLMFSLHCSMYMYYISVITPLFSPFLSYAWLFILCSERSLHQLSESPSRCVSVQQACRVPFSTSVYFMLIWKIAMSALTSRVTPYPPEFQLEALTPGEKAACLFPCRLIKSSFILCLYHG